MSDLWDYGSSEELPELSDSSGEAQARGSDSDADFLLPEKKRRKLQQLGSGGRQRGGKAADAAAAAGAQPGGGAKSADSDDDLLDSSPEQPGDAALAAQQAAAAAAGAGTPGRAHHQAALDARSSDLLRQLQATQAAMQHAAAEAEALQGGEGEGGSQAGAEPSPILQRYGGRYGAWRGGDGGSGKRAAKEEQGDSDFEILEETLSPVAAAAVAAAAPPPEEKIPLKLQAAADKVTVLNMRRTDPFSKMFHTYKQFALDKGWIASLDAPVRFIFDGEAVSADETPAGMDLEGEEVIEVHFLR